MTEAWLGGPVEGVPLGLQPAAHSLMDALEDMERAAADVTVEQLWARPGGAPSVGFHLRHVVGSTDRLLTYARGEPLTLQQLADIQTEADPGDEPATAAELLDALRDVVASTLDVYRATSPATLGEYRGVGRAGMPSTVQGLLFHVAEHARRHAGQVVATATVVKGLQAAGEEGLPGAEAVRAALVAEALRAYEDAGISGLCAEGRWEVAIGAVRQMDLKSLPG